MLGPRKRDRTGVYCVLHSGTSFPAEACRGAGWGSTLSAPAVCSSEKKQKAKQPKVILFKKKKKQHKIWIQPEMETMLRQQTYEERKMTILWSLTSSCLVIKKVYFSLSEVEKFIPHFLIASTVREAILYIKPRRFYNKVSLEIHQFGIQSESNTDWA